MSVFAYDQHEVDHLSRRCPKLGAVIASIGPLERPMWPDPFESLVRTILSQQISIRGAQTVCGRFADLAGEITPARVAALEPEAIQRCGTSMRKAEYIAGIAQAALSGSLDLAALPTMSDDDVIRHLSALRGVGVWTAEMLLIFSLGRPDVVSWLDLGIRKGMMILYGRKSLTPKQFATYRKRYHPYGSVASLYLWRLAGQ